MSVYSRAKTRQRLARAIEHSYPRELSAFIDYIAASHGASTQHTLHARALEYARIHYSDADFIAAGNAETEE